MKKFFPILFFFFVAPFFAFAYTSPGKPAGFVNDFVGVLTAEQKASLEQTLLQNEQATGNEISVVAVKTLDGETIEKFAEKLFEEWGIGKKGKDNGALLLAAIDDRKIRIEVGYGLEPVLTDAISSQIIRSVILPKFKQGDYYGGISDGVAQVVSVTRGEYIPAAAPTDNNPWWANLETDFFLFWLGLGIIEWLFAIMARSRSWWLGGVFGVVVGVVVAVAATVFIGLVVGAVLAPLGLLLDYFVSKEYSKSKELGKKPRWWAGGGPWLGGGFGGRGGGGGFSGFGGGRSGGGGASGGW
ncbi:MAG: TPM domain-containing protein [Candidatus Paceibacterota bacterium]|jgi:uncharacterized protein